MTEVIAKANAPKRHGVIRAARAEGWPDICVDVDRFVIEAERRHDVELTETKDVLDEEGLVIGITRLIETVDPGGVKAVGGQVKGVVSIERRVTVIDRGAKGEGAAFEHGAFAPVIAQADIDAAFIKQIRLQVVGKGGAPRKLSLRLSMSWWVYQPLAWRSQPSAKCPFIAQDDGVTIHPGVIEGRRGEIGLLVELLDGETARIAPVKLAAMKIEPDEVVFVNVINESEVGLPLGILAVVALAVGTSVKAIEPEVECPGRSRNHVVSLVKTVRTTDLFGGEAERPTNDGAPGNKIDRGRRLRPVEQAAAATNFLDLAHSLRHRQVVKGR